MKIDTDISQHDLSFLCWSESVHPKVLAVQKRCLNWVKSDNYQPEDGEIPEGVVLTGFMPILEAFVLKAPVFSSLSSMPKMASEAKDELTKKRERKSKSLFLEKSRQRNIKSLRKLIK